SGMRPQRRRVVARLLRDRGDALAGPEGPSPAYACAHRPIHSSGDPRPEPMIAPRAGAFYGPRGIISAMSIDRFDGAQAAPLSGGFAVARRDASQADPA